MTNHNTFSTLNQAIAKSQELLTTYIIIFLGKDLIGGRAIDVQPTLVLWCVSCQI